MQLKYSYYFFQKALPKETCNRIIEHGLEKIEKDKQHGVSTEAYTFGEKQKSAVEGGESQGEKTLQELKKEGKDLSSTYIRDSEVAWLNDLWIYDLVHPFIQEANAAAGWNWQWDYSESFQFTCYHGPGGFYGWHKDGASDHFGAYKRYIHGVTPEPLKPNGNLPESYVTDPAMVGKVRKLSMTLNLNDPSEYEGGNLKFDFGHHSDGDQFYECTEIREPGSIIVFPSFLDHCVTPVTSGTRYSLVLWCLGKPYV